MYVCEYVSLDRFMVLHFDYFMYFMYINSYIFHILIIFRAAENVASQWSVERSEQDEFALLSQRKCEIARNAGKFAEEIVSVVLQSRSGDCCFSLLFFKLCLSCQVQRNMPAYYIGFNE